MKKHFPVSTTVHVRFSDVDSMGHVNNAVYLSYLEEGRVAFFKKLLDLRCIDTKSAFGFIIAEINIRYKSPAFLDEELVVRLRIDEIMAKAFRLEYEILEKKTKRLVALATSIQVTYDYEKKTVTPVPKTLSKKFLSFQKDLIVN